MMKRMRPVVALVSGIYAVTCVGFELDMRVMSPKYHAFWNAAAQAKIDADIERYRKADGAFEIPAPDGTAVQAEQISHAFFFGAHIFNFDQLGTPERNLKYKELYGTLFNSATVAFYWKPSEPYPGALRFKPGYEDTENFWNNCADPKRQSHWRRPSPDPIIDFLKSRGCRIHGHPLTWGSPWHEPFWLFDDFCPEREKQALEAVAGMSFPRRPLGADPSFRNAAWERAWVTAWRAVYAKLSEREIAALAPTYVAALNRLHAERVAAIGARYGSRVDSWDVVNESSQDYHGVAESGFPCTKSVYGLMPGDYPLQAFRWAMKAMPSEAWLNINDFNGSDNFVKQTRDLIAHGAKIDVVGSQMHLFNPKDATAIAEGTFGEGTPAQQAEAKMWGVRCPEDIYTKFARVSQLGLPIHLSEITITAAGDNSPRDQMIQAIITRNLYRIWFSIERMNGITWWNVVDDCGAPGEPSYSGIVTRNLEKKPAFCALDDLINHEWRTQASLITKDGKVAFRGFRGRYRLTWKDASGKPLSKIVNL